MIPRAHLVEWRRAAPWVSDAQVEQDLIMSRALVAIFSQETLARKLAFRGGTALHKLYFDPPYRYSEDMDLVQIIGEPIGPVLDAIREALDGILGEPRRGRAEGSVTLSYRMESEVPPVTPMRLKVEINTREHFAVLGFRKRPFEVNSRWFAGQCGITTFALEELLGTKIRALYQRRKGRDLFDLWLGLSEGLADPALVVEVFRRYMEAEGSTVTRVAYEENLREKLRHPDFLGDLNALLPVGMEYDPERAFALIREEIIGRLD